MKLQLVFCAALALIGSQAMSQDVAGVTVSSAQYVSGAGITAAAPRYLKKDSLGRLIVLNQTATSSADFKLLRVDISGAPAFTTMATGANLFTALTNAGVASPPATLTVRGIGVATNDTIAIVTDDAAQAYLFVVTAPGTVALLAGNATNSPVDGANGLECVGNQACVMIENTFVATGGDTTDHVQAFDVTATANGTQAGTKVASEADMITAINNSATNASIRLSNAAVAVSSNQLLVANSGNAAATDELLLINTTLNTVSLAKSKASQLSDLSGDSDVGYNAMAYQVSNSNVYLWNNFGGTADDDLLKITSNGLGTLSVFVTDTAVEADTDFTGNGGTQLNVANGGMVIVGNALYWNDFTANATYKLVNLAAVNDWNIY